MPLPNGQYPDGKVGAGIDTIVIQDGRIITYATDCSLRKNNELEGIRTLGYYGDRDFKSLGFSGSLSIGTFLVGGDIDPGEVSIPGWQPDGTNNINQAGYFDFVFMDLHTNRVLRTAQKCKVDSEDEQFATRGLNTISTEWRCTRILPGLRA